MRSSSLHGDPPSLALRAEHHDSFNLILIKHCNNAGSSCCSHDYMGSLFGRKWLLSATASKTLRASRNFPLLGVATSLLSAGGGLPWGPRGTKTYKSAEGNMFSEIRAVYEDRYVDLCSWFLHKTRAQEESQKERIFKLVDLNLLIWFRLVAHRCIVTIEKNNLLIRNWMLTTFFTLILNDLFA